MLEFESMEKKIKKAKKVSGKELAWYIFGGIFAAAGIVFMVFGIIGYSLNVLPSDNWVKISENAAFVSWSKMGWLPWGLILFGFGALVIVLTMVYNAKKADREAEKENRRKQRQAALAELDAEEEQQPEQVVINKEDTTK